MIDGWIKSEDELYKLKKAESVNEVTSITLNLWMKLHGNVRVVLDFEKNGIYGTLFVPAGKGLFPGKVFLLDFCSLFKILLSNNGVSQMQPFDTYRYGNTDCGDRDNHTMTLLH